MNIVELMMIEHVSIRLNLRSLRNGHSDSLNEFEDFVLNCHARIEDELVFPKLNEMFASANEFSQQANYLSRLEADHKLIEKIGQQLRLSRLENNNELLKKRSLLFANTLEIHNGSEETLVFPYWKYVEAHDHIQSRAKQIIEQFGMDRYFHVSGISEELLEQLS